MLRPFPLIINIGAHDGASVRDFLDFGGLVVAFEPSDLADKIPGHDRLSVKKQAVWTERGTHDFYCFTGHDTNASSMYDRNFHGKQKVTVDCVTLDDALSGYGVVDYLAMNIEGAEIPVLKAVSDKTLLKVRQLCVEFHMDLESKQDVQDVIDRLKKLGFTVDRYLHSNPPDPDHPMIHARR